MDEIHDIHGLRVIVDNEEDCYKALEVVQQLWLEVPGRLKDYISQPKSNGSVVAQKWFSALVYSNHFLSNIDFIIIGTNLYTQ